jgi:hypothetical protein
MKALPETEDPILLRTHFTDEKAWKALCAAIQKPVGEFQAHLSPLSDRVYDGLDAKAVVKLASKTDHACVFIADRVALTSKDHAVLVVDLVDEPGRTFRVIPTEAWGVENNLSLANMDFAEFAEAAGKDGVFRGFR